MTKQKRNQNQIHNPYRSKLSLSNNKSNVSDAEMAAEVAAPLYGMQALEAVEQDALRKQEENNEV